MQINYYGEATRAISRPKPEPETIANTLIERMFLACATDEQIGKYDRLLGVGGHRGRGLATSYASRVVLVQFATLLSARTGLDYSELLAK